MSLCVQIPSSFSQRFDFLNNFTYLFLVVLGVHCYTGFSLSAVNRAEALVAVHGFLISVASPDAEHVL